MNHKKLLIIKFYWIWMIVFLFYFPKVLAVAPESSTYTQLMEQGDAFFQQGYFQQAVKHWEKTLALLKSIEKPSQRIDVLTRLAAAYQALGMHRAVFQTLDKASSLVQQTQDMGRNALILSQLSDAWLSIGESEEALSLAEESVADARTANQENVLARALNTQGNALAILKHYPQAIEAYQESAKIAEQTGELALVVRANLNQLHVALNHSPLHEIVTALADTKQKIATLPNSHDKATSLISVGKYALDLLQQNQFIKQEQQVARNWLQQDEMLSEAEQQFTQHWLHQKKLTTSEKQKILSQAYQAFQQALLIAKNLPDDRNTSIAYGYLGRLYEMEHRYVEALTLTRQAIFFAKQGDFPHSLYRWYWQQGRIFKAQGKLEPAITAFRLASQTLKPIQTVLDIGYRNVPGTFNERIKAVHHGLADLLLQKATLLDDTAAQQRLLKEAVETTEMVKVAELQNYFQDDCVQALQSKITGIEQISPGTAILHPIPLPDRLAIIVSVLGTFHQIVVPVAAEQLNETTWALRLGLQTRPNNLFLNQAKQLYDWLIHPIESLLKSHQIDTLVVVPDGKLRMIPFSTLYDGKHFLIENYAMALTPGLTLLDPHPIHWQNSKILLVGLSHAVQEYPPLPNVPKELQTITDIIYGVATSHRMLNSEYSLASFHNQLRANEYSVIHLATHGEFDVDPAHTYLLTHQEKMTMDKLQEIIGLGRFREKPLELLTLSACKTAVGDDKAALGLAGVAIKAGARSALATLWFVDDEATSIIMTEFYRQLLQTPRISKAKALQNAQKKLIAQERYWHPAYWAPFLLIGNWL